MAATAASPPLPEVQTGTAPSASQDDANMQASEEEQQFAAT
jgi:hypothetical protein